MCCQWQYDCDIRLGKFRYFQRFECVDNVIVTWVLGIVGCILIFEYVANMILTLDYKNSNIFTGFNTRIYSEN